MEKKEVVFEGYNPFHFSVGDGFDIKKIKSIVGVARIFKTGIKNKISILVNPHYSLEKVKAAVQAVVEAQ